MCLILSFYALLYRDLSLVNEIFWYTFVLYGSFLFHVCWLDWFYRLCKYINDDYGCFIVTRISFLLSLSFIVYVIQYIIIIKEDYISVNLHKWNINLRYVLYYINLTYNVSSYTVILILLYFIKLFSIYSLMLLGNYKFKLNWKSIIYILLFFIITMALSIWV